MFNHTLDIAISIASIVVAIGYVIYNRNKDQLNRYAQKHKVSGMLLTSLGEICTALVRQADTMDGSNNQKKTWVVDSGVAALEKMGYKNVPRSLVEGYTEKAVRDVRAADTIFNNAVDTVGNYIPMIEADKVTDETEVGDLNANA